MKVLYTLRHHNKKEWAVSLLMKARGIGRLGALNQLEAMERAQLARAKKKDEVKWRKYLLRQVQLGKPIGTRRDVKNPFVIDLSFQDRACAENKTKKGLYDMESILIRKQLHQLQFKIVEALCRKKPIEKNLNKYVKLFYSETAKKNVDRYDRYEQLLISQTIFKLLFKFGRLEEVIVTAHTLPLKPFLMRRRPKGRISARSIAAILTSSTIAYMISRLPEKP